MKRFASIVAVAAVWIAASGVQAQVIGTYRPSVVTYYPAAHTAPVAYQQPVNYAPASYTPASYSAANYAPASYAANMPYTTIGSSGVVSRTPVYTASYAGAAATGGNCYAPIQTVAFAPSAPCCPPTQTAFAPPVGLPVQAIAVPPPGTIDSQYFIGHGLLGRPKVFKVGQPLRNTVRRILP